MEKGRGLLYKHAFVPNARFASLSLSPFNMGQAESQMHNCCYEALSLLLPWVCLTLHPLEA